MTPDIHTLSSADIRAWQEQALARQLQYLQAHSPFYQELFGTAAIRIEDIKTLDDLTRIPTTSKDDFSSRNPDFLCVPRTGIIDYASTSGTTGRPVTIALTENDLQRLAANEAQSFAIAGAGPADVFQLMVTMDRQFMAGLAYSSGLRKLGAGVIRIGPASPQVQWDSIQLYRPDSIVVVPSFILKLIDYAHANNINLNNSGIKKAICIGEPIRDENLQDNALAARIRERWDIQLFSTYASTEMQTAFTECSHGRGGHLQPDLIILEILDESGQQAAPGETGEVAITTLGVEGMPLLRYRTGDICSVYTGPCPCGRNSPRISPVIGRKNQMIKYKGTTLFPAAIFDAIRMVPAVVDYLVEVGRDQLGNDDITIHLHHMGTDDAVRQDLRRSLDSALKVSPVLHFVSAAQIQQMKMTEGRKPVSVVFRC